MKIYDFSARSIDGAEQSLSSYQQQVLLVVNVASQCGLTPQYAGLEALQKKFGARSFSVLGFPCDQFGHQEPGDEAEIKHFCQSKFHVSFPLFAKIEVNGAGAHPLYQYLKSAAPGILGTEAIKWNFTKFLIGRNGEVLKRYAPTDTPESITADLEAALGARP